MRLIETKDKSFTFFNEEYQSEYHSLSGALEEAEEKYVKALAVEDGDSILDVCFGMGYNSYAVLKATIKVNIVALEKDEKILAALQSIDLPEPYSLIKKLAKEKVYEDDNYSLQLVLGPAQETIKTIHQKFDKIFLDPFSPKKNPELWTIDFLQEIFFVLKPEGKLATYSCARVVRDNLKTVGFLVFDGPHVGRRGPSTIAIKPASCETSS